ncbi:hypothetical protein Hbor_33020 (plasmid) [Halogeometricum borinquense DSM 11551]|uniref:Uncharacterized protein n=2 Tax=Halogeometricum borinquense TaxID=60847 RepID=E4NVE4_HALBP|nr:hypothetical protein Hbor_33020 [Halogeometricum borinquense DSM 11551]
MKYRRSFIATLSLSAFAGCLSSNDDNGGTPTDTGGTPTDVTETATDPVDESGRKRVFRCISAIHIEKFQVVEGGTSS